jgi:hypothetical protein
MEERMKMEGQEESIVPQQPQQPQITLGQKAAMFLPMAATIGIGDAILQAPPPIAVGLLIAAGIAVHKSPEILASFRQERGNEQRTVQGTVEKTVPVQHQPTEQKWSLMDRLLGKHLQAVPPAVAAGQGQMPASHLVSHTAPSPFLDSPTDRLPPPPAMRQKSGLYRFSSVLETFTPTLDRIFLGEKEGTGEPIFVAAENLCHVATAGNTGGGKTNIQRLLMMQLCKAGAQVLLLNPHYTRYDLAHDEDWTPYEPHLVYDPMECRSYDSIEFYLRYIAETLLPERLDRYAHSRPLGKPYFLVLDELPAIVRHVKIAAPALREILEQGRKVGIFLITAAQDFLISTIAPGGSGGSIRECYRTAYYAGGDAQTARTLLDLERGKSGEVPETRLGKGLVMLRCAGSSNCKQATLVRVPYVDNAALYRLLGPSTFQPEPEPTETDRLPDLPTAPRSAVQYQSVQVSGQREVTTEPVPTLARGQGKTRAAPRELVQAQALLRLRPGMTYRELGAKMGLSDEDARALYLELKRRGLLPVRRGAGQAVERVPVPDVQGVQQSSRGQAQGAQVSSVSSVSDLDRAMVAWDAGHTSIDALAAALGLSQWRARALYQQVKQAKQAEQMRKESQAG